MSEIIRYLDETLALARDREFVLQLAKSTTVIGDLSYNKPINISIAGISGMGKTAIITQWGEDHADEINFVIFDAAWLRMAELERKKIIFSTAEIERMSKPNTVVFIDNYQTLRKDVEEELNKFLDYRKVMEISGEKELDNVLFVVVAVTSTF